MLILWRHFIAAITRDRAGIVLDTNTAIAAYTILRIALANPDWEENGVHPAASVLVASPLFLTTGIWNDRVKDVLSQLAQLRPI